MPCLRCSEIALEMRRDGSMSVRSCDRCGREHHWPTYYAPKPHQPLPWPTRDFSNEIVRMNAKKLPWRGKGPRGKWGLI